jgi:hypothetical protein
MSDTSSYILLKVNNMNWNLVSNEDDHWEMTTYTIYSDGVISASSHFHLSGVKKHRTSQMSDAEMEKIFQASKIDFSDVFQIGDDGDGWEFIFTMNQEK